MKVLFLSVSIGGGHNKAAQAVEESIKKLYPQSDTLIIDTIKYVNPLIDKLIVKGYLNTLKTSPLLYKKLYEISDTDENIYDFSNVVNKLLSRKIKKLINYFNPNIIICTHPFPAQMISTMKKRGKISVPVATILTDFIIHNLWIQNPMDAYFVAHEYMKEELINRGVPEEIIFPVGIPVLEKFKTKLNREKVLSDLGFSSDKPVFLLMGGSLGIGKIDDVFRSLVFGVNNFQVIVITGDNKKLLNHLNSLCKTSNKNVKLFEYTDEINTLMDASDFIITKPGGVTISEALIKELPIIIISPIPGQEERNARFLINSGAAVELLKNEKLQSLIYHILKVPMRKRHMKEISRYLSKPNASNDIVSILNSKLIKKH